jgi:hypothetical protein
MVQRASNKAVKIPVAALNVLVFGLAWCGAEELNDLVELKDEL